MKKGKLVVALVLFTISTAGASVFSAKEIVKDNDDALTKSYTVKKQTTQESRSKVVKQDDVINNSFENIDSFHLEKTNHNQIESYRDFNGQKVVDWEKPTGAHPDLTVYDPESLTIAVDQKSQRLAVYHEGKQLTQLVISTGIDGAETPSGKFKIEAERGSWFYNNDPDVQEGAKNWVSFKDHGVYLFHSIVYDNNQQYIMNREGKLGQRNSHGCIQMSLPDSVWFYNNVRQNVNVIINKV